MPQQEVFFEQATGERRVEVLKTYDQGFAREAFENMDELAQTHLWKSLGIDETYEPEDVPRIHTDDSDDFLWEELLEAACEDGSLLSFFVVNEAKGLCSESVYVAPDWPSAEAFAKSRLADAQP